jgi:hypothetical protein
LREEYFSNAKDHFIAKQLSTDPDLADISKTIAINCKAYPINSKKELVVDVAPDSNFTKWLNLDPINNNNSNSNSTSNIDQLGAAKAGASELDTTTYARFKPLQWDSKRKYYYRRDILIPEGWRRSADDNVEIAKVQALYDKETDPLRKQILQDELDQFQWRGNILLEKDKKTGLSRSMRNITSDYYPAEIGMQRIWREPHSHIPDYSHSLNYGYLAYPSSK